METIYIILEEHGYCGDVYTTVRSAYLKKEERDKELKRLQNLQEMFVTYSGEETELL